MKVAVTSASGKLGSAIAKSLIEEIGVNRVVGIARSPENAEALGVEIRKGDYDLKQDFIRAFRDIDVVLLVSSSEDPERRKQQHIHVIDAAKETGVRKVVYTSVLGSEDNTGFSKVVDSNRYTEEYLMNSGLQWVIGRSE